MPCECDPRDVIGRDGTTHYIVHAPTCPAAEITRNPDPTTLDPA